MTAVSSSKGAAGAASSAFSFWLWREKGPSLVSVGKPAGCSLSLPSGVSRLVLFANFDTQQATLDAGMQSTMDTHTNQQQLVVCMCDVCTAHSSNGGSRWCVVCAADKRTKTIPSAQSTHNTRQRRLQQQQQQYMKHTAVFHKAHAYRHN